MLTFFPSEMHSFFKNNVLLGSNRVKKEFLKSADGHVASDTLERKIESIP